LLSSEIGDPAARPVAPFVELRRTNLRKNGARQNGKLVKGEWPETCQSAEPNRAARCLLRECSDYAFYAQLGRGAA
jgi:hypothetical protein